MSDAELLEAAARAAGITLYSVHPLGEEYGFKIPGASEMSEMANWNPLIDDRDAFQLSVNLHIDVYHDAEVGEVGTAFMVGRCGHRTVESYGPLRDGSQDDPLAATRRAVVRAAAEIGRAKEEKESA